MMRRIGTVVVLALLLMAPGDLHAQARPVVELPAPTLDGAVSLEAALQARRSKRRFEKSPLTDKELGQLLWAAQGINDPEGKKRTAPSAGARYPVTLYVFTPEGMFRYLPKKHAVEKVLEDDRRAELWKHVYARPWLKDAPAIFFITANYEVTAKKYGKKAQRFVDIESGHIGQNLLLQATALGLGCVPLGAFHEKRVIQTIELPSRLTPVYFVAVGRLPEDDQK